jgi:hypothetical protein
MASGQGNCEEFEQGMGTHFAVLITFRRKKISATPRREEETLRAADKGVSTLIEPEELIGGAGNPDAHSFSDRPDGMADFAQPERAGSAKVEAIVAAVDLEGGGEASGPACEIENSSGLAMALHEFDAFERLEGADKDRGGDSGGLADDIEHEVRAVIEKDVGVAGREIHRANARSWPAEVMSGRIARRIGLCFHDATAEAARREIVHDDFPDEEASELDGVMRKFGASHAPNKEFVRRGFHSGASRGHGKPRQRERIFCRSSDETRS